MRYIFSLQSDRPTHQKLKDLMWRVALVEAASHKLCVVECLCAQFLASIHPICSFNTSQRSAVNYNSNEITTLVAAFLALLWLEQSPALVQPRNNHSDLSSTDCWMTVGNLHSAGLRTGYQIRYNTIKPHELGPEAVWIAIEGMNGWPDKYQATFEASFYSDCPGVRASLVIIADDVFTAFLNGKTIGTGMWDGRWTSSTFSIEPLCGVNMLKVVVVNYNAGSPGSLIFKVVQDRTNCYKCSPGANYNFDTCTCQCEQQYFTCPTHKAYVDYPACGCKCINQHFSNCNPTYQNFNQATCSCQCRTMICPFGLEQDPSSCMCKCKSKECGQRQRWNYNRCACEAIPCVKRECESPKVWSDSTCGCICPSDFSCPLSLKFDPGSCTCK